MEHIVPDLVISKELIERIQFSVSSRNAEAKLSECAAHVFAAQYSDNPNNIQWQYVSSGVACLLRNRELAENGRKYMWSLNLCLYNASYGVLVWKAKIHPNSDYTAVADNFHMFALGEVDVIVGLMFSSKDKACELNTTYTRWHQERVRDDGKKGNASAQAQSAGEPARFRKEMISKPCNFQHIQGTQAIDECMDIEKIKADIIAAFFGLGTKVGRSATDGQPSQKKKKKKKDQPKQRLQFREIILPQTQSTSDTSPPPVTTPLGPETPPATATDLSPTELPPTAASVSPQDMMVHQDSQGVLPPMSQSAGQFSSEMANGYEQSAPTQQAMNPLLQQNSSVSLGGGYDPNFSPTETNGYPVVTAHTQGSVRVISPSQGAPNYQNPASPAFQEYSASGQESYSFNIAPQRMDMSLEKEFAESALFKSSIPAN